VCVCVWSVFVGSACVRVSLWRLCEVCKCVYGVCFYVSFMFGEIRLFLYVCV